MEQTKALELCLAGHQVVAVQPTDFGKMLSIVLFGKAIHFELECKYRYVT